MTCEHARDELLTLTKSHSEACKRLYEFTEEYVQKSESNPLVLVSGYRETLDRLEREAEQLAQRHRSALDAYVAHAVSHADGESPT